MSKAQKLKSLGCTKHNPLLKDQKFKNIKSIRLLIKEKDSGCIKVINVESLLIFEKILNLLLISSKVDNHFWTMDFFISNV